MQKKVGEIFNNKVFSIPSYRRDCAWEAKNLDDLREYLLEAEKAKNGAMGHFLGTIVVAENPQDSKVYDIVDGQQRITTLFMLRYALNCKTKNPQRRIVYFLDEKDNLRLQLVKDSQEFFAKILKQAEEGNLNSALEKEAKTERHKRLYKVFKAILKHVKDLDAQEAEKHLNTLDEMVLIWLEEKDSDRAMRTFQSVNDRGVPVLLLDKLKALLVLHSNKYCGGALDKAINERFREMFKIAAEIKKWDIIEGEDAESKVFTYHTLGQGIGHFEYDASKSYEKIKDLLTNKVKALQDSQDKEAKTKELQVWLDDYSKDLRDFFKAFLEVAKMTEYSAEAFKVFYVLEINRLFYSSLVRLQINKALDDECLRLFAQADILLFKVGSENNTKAFELYKFAGDKNTFKQHIIQACKECYKGRGTDTDINKAIESMYKTMRLKKDEDESFYYLFLSYHSKNTDIEVFWKLESEKYPFITTESIISQNLIDNGSLGNMALRARRNSMA